MHTIIAGVLGGTEIMVVVIVALVLFGARKIPEFAKGLGQGIKEFKKASAGVTNEFQNAMSQELPAPAPLSRCLPPKPPFPMPLFRNPDGRRYGPLAGFVEESPLVVNHIKPKQRKNLFGFVVVWVGLLVDAEPGCSG